MTIRHSERVIALFAGERGELTVSEPTPIDTSLVDAAMEGLPWEADGINGGSNKEQWDRGQYWHATRIKLTNLWVLPRDMSNGSWDVYAVAANAGEQKVLQRAPQLLRLATEDVVDSARTVLSIFSLPPALLRKEPELLTLDSESLRRGFDSLQKVAALQRHKVVTDSTSDSVSIETLRELCRDTPGLLYKAALEGKVQNLDPDKSPDQDNMETGVTP